MSFFAFLRDAAEIWDYIIQLVTLKLLEPPEKIISESCT